jgi:hypothetical protein
MISVLHYLGDVAVWVATISSFAFCFTYAAIAPWNKTAEGRHLMTFTFVIGVAFSWVAYRLVTVGPRHHFNADTEAARAIIYIALASVLVWRLMLLIRVQIRRRRNDDKDHQ